MADGNNEPYVLVQVKQKYEPSTLDDDGNVVPAGSGNLPDYTYFCRETITEAHFPETETVGVNCFSGCTNLLVADFPVL